MQYLTEMSNSIGTVKVFGNETEGWHLMFNASDASFTRSKNLSPRSEQEAITEAMSFLASVQILNG